MFNTKKDFALLARQVQVSSRDATDNSSPFLVDVYQVKLWKLLNKPDKADVEAIGQTFKCNPQELLHTIVALYDKSLSDIGGETIYDTICEPKVVTVLVVYDDPNVVLKEPNITAIVTNEDDCLDTLLENVDYPDSVFHEVFSDPSTSESSDESDESDSDDNEHDYSVGLGKFLEKVKAEKINFHKRLIACLSFQKITSFPMPSQEEHVVDLQLVACRKKFRGRGIGRHLLRLLMDHNYIGEYDAVVTASDQSAIDFYRKFGFTDDAILLSKYKNIGDSWTNTTKMCYLPPYNVVHDDPIRCLTMMDDQFQKWQKTMFSSYQNQAALFNRLKSEMIGLYAKVNTQEQIIMSLNRERFLLAKENASLKAKLSKLKVSPDEPNNEDAEKLETYQMIQDMEKLSIKNEKLLIAQMSLLMDDDCNTQMAVEFCKHKLKQADKYHIKAKKITVDAATIALYQSGLASLSDEGQKNETLLFYFGHHEHLDIIAHAGFTGEDFLYGSFGKGLYFHSTLSNLQAQKIQRILLCKVALGRVELVSKSKAKSSITLKRNTEYNSVKIFDTEMSDDDDNEIVIFDSHLALPLFIITVE